MSEITIYRTDDRSAVVFAADELKRLLSAMDPDARITVVSGSDCANDAIRIGLDPASGVPESETEDAVFIDVSGSRGVITGSNPRSVLIAVYRYLKELGCRFVRPGKNGEKIPRKKAGTDTVFVRETASYPHRGVCIEGSVSYENVLDMIDFLPKVGMNEYFIQFMVPTEFFARWYQHRGSTALGPEWDAADDPRGIVTKMTAALEGEIKKRGLRYHKVGHGWTCEPFGISGDGWDKCEIALTEDQRAALAEVNGKRELWGDVPLNTNLCYSNKKVRDTVTDAIVRYAANNPQIDVIHFWLADGSNNHCECPGCRDIRPSDWYVRMLNELDRKLTAANIDTKIVFLIYVDLLWEPETEKIENPDRFILMFAPITRSYGKNYGDYLEYGGTLPPYVRNRLQMPSSLAQNIEHLRRWQSFFNGDSFDFDYHLMWAHVGDIGYEKCAANLFRDMRDLRKLGLGGMVSCQIQRCFLPTALPFISMAAALWDENADFDRTADDYYRSAFGEKGPAVRRAMQTLSASCRLYEKEADMWDRETAIRGRDMLLTAAGDDPKFEELRLYAGYLDLLYAVFDALEAKDRDAVGRAADRLFDYMWKAEPALQELLDVHNSVNTVNRLIRERLS